MTSSVEWWSVDFKTGVRGTRLLTEEAGRLSRIIGTATDTTVRVRCADKGVVVPGWDDATTVGRNLLLCVDAASDRPLWGGISRRRTSDGGPWVSVSASTIESYLYRRYINSTLTWTDADPTQVAVDVLGQVTGLTPLAIDSTMVGNAVIDGYYDTNLHKRVGQVLADLSGIAGGIEWTVNLEWSDADHQQLAYVVRIAPRIGVASTAPATQWTMPGAVTGFTYIEDFGEETGANDVIALSSGEGSSTPSSSRYEDTALLTAYARFERRFTPATSITSTSTLDQYAEAALAANRLGLTQLDITANLDSAPRVGQDWWMGDDIDVHLTCDRFPAQLVNGVYEPGYTRVLRTVGWEMDLGARTLTPKVFEESE